MLEQDGVSGCRFCDDLDIAPPADQDGFFKEGNVTPNSLEVGALTGYPMGKQQGWSGGPQRGDVGRGLYCGFCGREQVQRARMV